MLQSTILISILNRSLLSKKDRDPIFAGKYPWTKGDINEEQSKSVFKKGTAETILFTLIDRGGL